MSVRTWHILLFFQPTTFNHRWLLLWLSVTRCWECSLGWCHYSSLAQPSDHSMVQFSQALACFSSVLETVIYQLASHWSTSTAWRLYLQLSSWYDWKNLMKTSKMLHDFTFFSVSDNDLSPLYSWRVRTYQLRELRRSAVHLDVNFWTFIFTS